MWEKPMEGEAGEGMEREGREGCGKRMGPWLAGIPPPHCALLCNPVQSTFARPEASEGKKKCNNPKIAEAMQRLDRQRCAQTPGDSYSTFALQCLKKSTRRTEK